MTIRDMTQAIFEGGVQSNNFFNGQLLSGEDLNREKAANQIERQRLGQILGDGVAYGLTVAANHTLGTTGSPVVTIQPGLAINRAGQTLALSVPVNLGLVRSASGQNGNGSSDIFTPCLEPEEGVYVAGAGLYVLTILPVEKRQGLAPVSGLGNGPLGCNKKYVVSGVQFRLIQVDLSPVERGLGKRLRNYLAYKAFGINDPGYRAFFGQVFGPPVTGYGLLDALRPTGPNDARPQLLHDCEIPLALLYWTSTGGLEFVDMWAVRRRVTPPDGLTRWPLLLGNRRRSETEAMIMQFQDQLQALRVASDVPAALQARDYLHYVPPAGIVPLVGDRHLKGFDFETFFSGVTYRDPVYIEGSRVETLLRAALTYQPVDLDSGLMIWLYLIRENRMAIVADPLNPPQEYMIYASGHMPFFGDPHYDVNRFDYANYF